MKNIAIITGGDSQEYEISLKSAETVYNNLDKKKYKPFLIKIRNNIWKHKINNIYKEIDKNNFSIEVDNKLIVFREVFIALHGPPAENGELQMYFDKKNIKYTCCNSKISALTFDKYKCNQVLKELKYKIAKSQLHIKEQAININQIVSKFIFPLIVKPNQAGSSNGISMVHKKEELLESINNALLHDDKVIIEEYIKGIEVSCGAFKNKDEIIILPITEIISENDFFDYDAKYNNKSKEITPARISKKETEIIQRNTKKIYSKFNLKGLCRIDYIIKEKQPYIIEINTIPGLSEKSIIPQQLKEAGYNLTEVFTICLEN